MIKKMMIIVILSMSVNSVFCQPVTWKYHVIKTAGRTFELHIIATIEKGWHLYSQEQPADAIAFPTSIHFASNPLLQFDSVVKEIGNREKYNNSTLGIEDNQYSGLVEFVQKIYVKADVKTNIEGTIRYQTCTEEKCLPPATVIFSMTLNSKG